MVRSTRTAVSVLLSWTVTWQLLTWGRCKQLSANVGVKAVRYCCCFSQDIQGQHKTGESYRYVIGVCVDVGDDYEKHRDCGIMQYSNNFSHCLGKLNSVQTSRSKFGE